MWPLVSRQYLLQLQQVGDIAIWVDVSSSHRDEAFATCRYIIDELKYRVPI